MEKGVFGHPDRGYSTMGYEHTIDRERCKGCGLCVNVCPKKVLELSKEVNTRGYFPAVQAHPEKCVFCSACCIMCPDVAITIEETVEETD
jgi:2-oxoglutarate ferredoxin oxidoreductase subunit delta